MRKNIAAGAVMLAILGSGCVAKNPAHGDYDLMLMTEDEEFEIGHDVARKEIQQHGLYKEKPELTKYYQTLSRQLIDITERSDKPFEFIMLDSDDYNAWATPGYLNMYRGMLPFFENEAAFIAVMAHEAGHITARHAARRHATANVARFGTALGAIAAGIATNSSAASNAVVSGANQVAKVGFAKYSRSFEDEADALSARYLTRLGYDVTWAATWFKHTQNYEQFYRAHYRYFHGGANPPDSVFYDLMSTHPDSGDRADHVADVITDLDEKPTGNKVNRDIYLSKIDGIAYGPNFRAYGAAGRNTLYDVKNRFTLSLPEGYLWHFNGSTWRAYNDALNVAVFVTPKRVGQGLDAEEALRIVEPKLRQLQPVTLGGMQGYTGVQSIYERSDSLFSKDKLLGLERVFAVKTNTEDDTTNKSPNLFLISFVASSEASFGHLDNSFFNAVASLKELSKTKAKQLQPLRVKIITVKNGDTVEKLAEQLPFGNLRMELFLALNNLQRNAELQPGSKLKTIVDPNLGLKF